MSLGIKLLGRAQSRSLIGFGISLVPRGPPTCSCGSVLNIPRHYRPTLHTYSTAQEASRATSSDLGESAQHAALETTTAAAAAPVIRDGARSMAVEDDSKLKLSIQRASRALKDKSDCFVPHGTRRPHTGLTRVAVNSQSVLDHVVMRYANKKATSSSLTRHFKRKHQQLRIEELQARHDVNLPDWRFVLDILRKRTPLATWDTPSNSRTLLISGEVADVLLHEVDKTLWDVAGRTDCELVLHKAPTNSETSGEDERRATVVLHGSDGAIEAAKGEIMQLTEAIMPSAQGASLEDMPGQPGTELVAGMDSGRVWSSMRPPDRPGLRGAFHWSGKYEEIEQPNVWTKRTLEEYLTAIAGARLSPRKKTKLYGSGTQAAAAAVSLMRETLCAEDTSDALSTRAFIIALDFMARHGPSFRPQTRQLLQHMIDTGVPLDTRVFNILLSSNAKGGDLKNFQILLHKMTTRGFLPNLNTWRCFLDLVGDREVKQHIFRSMNGRGLLDGLKGRQAVAHQLVVFDLEHARGRWQGINQFLESQGRRYGPGWMSRQAVDAIMNELGRLGKLASCIDFLDFIQQQPDGPSTSTITLNILLSHAKSHQTTDLVLVALARFHKTGTAFDETTYNELFDLFFTTRKANALGVVWRLACLEGKTSYHMRARVSDMYQNCPFLVSPDIPMPGLGLPKVASRLNTTNRAKARYWAYAHLPTLHHPDMSRQLVDKGREPASRVKSAEVDLPAHGAPRLRPSAGSIIADLFRRRWRFHQWRPTRPLHALIAEALEADHALARDSKERKQLAERASADAGFLEMNPEMPTNVDRQARTGVQILLARRQKAERPRAGKTPALDPAAREADGSDPSPRSGGQRDTPSPAREASRAVMEQPWAAEMVTDISATIYSRTYGVVAKEPSFEDGEVITTPEGRDP